MLATYSYYPYNWGGAEVYVSALAKHLVTKGHFVQIIAAVPDKAFEEHTILFEDESFRSTSYFFENIEILGAQIKKNDTDDIYNKYQKSWVESWFNILKKKVPEIIEILHFHAYTMVIGTAIAEAVMKHTGNTKIMASYHIPYTCVKGTLSFAHKKQDCTVAPGTHICTSCQLSERLNLPINTTQLITRLIPIVKPRFLPTALRLKYLTSRHIAGFKYFDSHIQKWQVFSIQIQNILKKSGVASNRINFLRHGINNIFSQKKNNLLEDNCTNFLYVGRFEKNKGLLTLLKSWDNLPETDKRHLHLVGENQINNPEIRNWLNKISRRNDITIYGKKNQIEIHDIMQQMHCTIIPSECIEIGPMVFHEAIASGNDVIASDIGGCKELANLYSDKSRVFRSGNYISLKKAILNYKTNYKRSEFNGNPIYENEHYSVVENLYFT